MRDYALAAMLGAAVVSLVNLARDVHSIAASLHTLASPPAVAQR